MFIAFCAPIVAFALFAFARTPGPSSTEGREFLNDFLTTSSSSQAGAVGASTVAYMLQISTTFYFVYWGYKYGLGNIFYVISWAIGIWWFGSCSRQLLSTRENFETLAHFLSGGNGKAVRAGVGSLFCLFFLGLLYVETLFAADFLSSLFTASNQSHTSVLWWIFFVLLLVSVASYSFIGGMRKVIETDRYQLSIAYVGFAIVFAYLVPMATAANLPTGVLLWAFAVLIYWFIQSKMQGDPYTRVVRHALWLSLLILIGSLIVASPWNSPQDFFQPLKVGGFSSQLTEEWGWVTLLVFSAVNILWQFGDASNYQRISCLQLDSQSSEQERATEIQRYLSKITVVAPLTWGFGILMGMLLAATGIIQAADGSEYSTFLKNLAEGVVEGDLGRIVVTASFAITISVVMLSTADSALLAYLQAAIQDSPYGARANVGTIVVFALLAILGVLGIAVAHKAFDQVHVFTIVGTFNSFVLLMSIPALAKQLGIGSCNAGSNSGLWVTLCLGIPCIVVATFWPFSPLPLNVAAVLPYCGALVGAGFGLMVSLASGRSSSPSKPA